MEDLDELIASRIIQIRTERGESQADFSKRLRDAKPVGLNWSQGTLSKVESAQRPVRLAEAVTLAEILGIPIDELVAPTDFVARRVEEEGRRFSAAESAVLHAQTTARWCALRVVAIQLIDELRSAGVGEYVVTGCSPRAFVEYVVDPSPANGDKELHSLMVSIGEGVSAERLRARARTRWTPGRPTSWRCRQR